MSSPLQRKQYIKHLELALILSLLNWDIEKSEGWQNKKTILRKKYFTSQSGNFERYMNFLIDKTLVEKKEIKGEKGSRGRLKKRTVCYYRLIPSLNVYDELENIMQVVKNESNYIRESLIRALEREYKRKRLPDLWETSFWILLNQKFSTNRIKSLLVRNLRKQLNYLNSLKKEHEGKIVTLKFNIERITEILKDKNPEKLRSSRWHFPKLLDKNKKQEESN